MLCLTAQLAYNHNNGFFNHAVKQNIYQLEHMLLFFSQWVQFIPVYHFFFLFLFLNFKGLRTFKAQVCEQLLRTEEVWEGEFSQCTWRKPEAHCPHRTKQPAQRTYKHKNQLQGKWRQSEQKQQFLNQSIQSHAKYPLKTPRQYNLY